MKHRRIYLTIALLLAVFVVTGFLFKIGILEVIGLLLAIPMAVMNINALEARRQQK